MQQTLAPARWGRAAARRTVRDRAPIGCTNVNGRFARGAGFDPGSRRLLTSEYAAEVYYRFELRPNFQYAHHPGGRGDLHDIGVFGQKVGVHV